MSGVARRPTSGDATASANRRWWDSEASSYYNEHGPFLGDDRFVWGPEGWTEAELDILEARPTHTVLEVGAGGAQCSRWLAGEIGCRVVATDLSAGMLGTARRIDRSLGRALPLAQCDATRLPFPDAVFDRVFTAYGAVPFVADTARLMREMARVTVPGGRVVYSTSHPWRWAFPDDPGEAGLTVRQSYFDERPYLELDDDDRPVYVEHHRTLEHRVAEAVSAGLVIEAVRELPWKDATTSTWGGWSPSRGRLIPGTLVLVARRS
ncbi:methyltransferase domain-containing protein [Nostocoides sp. F2B08]|uniref:class I SAM-dependent methyltransferase n=1 Tax=Nostocoides sp. F2B08 TaxID=2653936 RepID=UPI001262C24F|nr:class I SAM-dependent methyltransferase [Tetrasphaera sp. F2B08]KAB7744558.1 methyltransferase domain-containing protein [Tetrasphaera sp. F2B08]